jgi:probable HAF family extracellular repeat protein
MRKSASLLSVAFLLAAYGNACGQAQYTVTDLGTLPGGSSSEAYGINNSAQVAGDSYASSGFSHAFLYSGGSMTDIGALGVNNTFAYGINNSGQVVGY